MHAAGLWLGVDIVGNGVGETCPFGIGAPLTPATAANTIATTEIFILDPAARCESQSVPLSPQSGPLLSKYELFQALVTFCCVCLVRRY